MPRARDERPSDARRRSGRQAVPASAGVGPRRRGYLAVLVLFCFGFLGVLAFLSIVAPPGWSVGPTAVAPCDRSLRARRKPASRHRRDDLAPDPLELLALVAVHQVDVELVDAGVREDVELLDDLVDLAEDAEPVRDLVADEAGVRRADLGVVVVVVAGAVLDVAGQRLRELLARVLVDEVDDVVRDQRREPARPLAADVARAEVERRRGLDLDGARVAPGRRARPRGPGR